MIFPGVVAGQSWQQLPPASSLRVLAVGTSGFLADLYDAATGEDLSASISSKPPATARAVAVNSAGTLVAVGSTSAPYLKLYNTADWSVVAGPAQSAAIYSVAFSDDDSKLALGTATAPRLKLYNTSDWSSIPVALPPTSGTTSGLAFSQGGTMLAAAGTSTYLVVYDPSTGERIIQSSEIPNQALSVAFTKGDSVLAVGHASGQYLTLLDTSTWAKITLAEPPLYNVAGLASSPDGSILVAATAFTPYVHSWNTADWSLRPQPAILPQNQGYSAAFSRDGSKIAIGHYSGTSSGPVATVYEAETMARPIAMPIKSSFQYAYGIAFVP